jgi:hypothetical protein
VSQPGTLNRHPVFHEGEDNMTLFRRALFLQNVVLLMATFMGRTVTLGQDQSSQPQKFLVLRHFAVQSPEKQQLILSFLADTGVGALNRAGVEPVGVFKPAAQQGSEQAAADHSVYMLTQFDSLDDWVAAHAKLEADKSFGDSASEYLGTPKDDPAYTRIHVTLLRAFKGFPAIQKPETGPRIFELRTYESHSEHKAKLKVAMFNEGELDVFKKVGMRPVFFGEAVAGPNLPSLTYMLVYKDADEERQVWDRFRNDPDWHAMRDLPQYADTVSRIHRVFLVPADCSQL